MFKNHFKPLYRVSAMPSSTDTMSWFHRDKMQWSHSSCDVWKMQSNLILRRAATQFQDVIQHRICSTYVKQEEIWFVCGVMISIIHDSIYLSVVALNELIQYLCYVLCGSALFRRARCWITSSWYWSQLIIRMLGRNVSLLSFAAGLTDECALLSLLCLIKPYHLSAGW